MIYDEEEITARVAGTYSDLYSLNEKGGLDKSLDIIIYNDDEEVVWYEVGGMTHLHCLDTDGVTKLYFTEIPSIAEAKRRIDRYRNQNPIND